MVTIMEFICLVKDIGQSIIDFMSACFPKKDKKKDKKESNEEQNTQVDVSMKLDIKTKCKDANKINVLPKVNVILDKDSDKDNDENEDVFRERILGDYVCRHCGYKNRNQRNMKDH